MGSFPDGQSRHRRLRTVTLELALADVPIDGCYIVGYIEGEIARRLIVVEHAALPNVVLDAGRFPNSSNGDGRAGSGARKT